jgi:LuxR family maltose regulon positive regulatory protein
MTLSIATHDLDTSTRRGWAVVEIRDDGTLGRSELVTAGGPATAAEEFRSSAPPSVDPAGLTAQVGILQAAEGRLPDARHTLLVALRIATSDADRARCAGPLALVEAFQGDLHDAETHAMVCLAAGETGSVAFVHAQAAQAWIHLGRAELEDVLVCLALVDEFLGEEPGPWLVTTVTLAKAELLLATGQPDAATRLLAEASEVHETVRTSDWMHGALAAARADALLAAGEPHRALATVTPLPERAVCDASVAAAAARREIGDVRGAGAVLGSATPALEGAPLPLQIRARVVESRLADERGDRERACHLVDRALRSASAECLRSPLRSDWRWMRAFLDREPRLKHRHREFVASLDLMDVPKAGQHDAPLGAALTVRESEVLELMAQMYSTEEIARTLYVSANTVKTHVKGIFGKLGVNRRVDAVRRGRQLGQC